VILPLNRRFAESSGDATQSVERNWPHIKQWVERPEALLQVLFQRGKITKVCSMDRTQRWKLIHEYACPATIAPETLIPAPAGCAIRREPASQPGTSSGVTCSVLSVAR
jgi:hypothetical protein